MKPHILVFALTGSMIMPLAVNAETISLKLYAIGIKAGTIQIKNTQNGNSYVINGTVVPSKFLKMIKDIGFIGTASGKVYKNAYHSKKYAGHLRTGNRNSIVKMHWNGRTPVVDSYQPAREKRSYDIAPSKQTGVIDLLTAGYATFKSRSVNNLCNTTYPMFDGRRRSQITLGKPKISGKIATCTGSYRRIAGFSPHDMEKRVNFPFTMHYEQQDDGMYRFKDFTADATFGKIRAIRQ